MVKYIVERYRCLTCGNIMPISRYRSKIKTIGHPKHMWYYRCDETSKFLKLRSS